MWQVMSSRYEVLARARAALKKKREKKPDGPWGGCVKERVERVQQRRRVALHAILLPDEVLRLMCVHASQPSVFAARAACVCHTWCSALREPHVFSCVHWVLPHVAPEDIASMSAACVSLARMFAATRARMHSKAMRMQQKHMEGMWMDVRVGVPWDVDKVGRVYFGTVIGVRNAGRCLRVMLDTGAGKDRLRAHTIPVHELFVAE